MFYIRIITDKIELIGKVQAAKNVAISKGYIFASWVINYKTFIKTLLTICPKALTKRRKKKKREWKLHSVLFSGNRIKAEKS